MSTPRDQRRHALTIALCAVIGALLVLGGISSVGSSPAFGIVTISIGGLFLAGGVALFRHTRR